MPGHADSQHCSGGFRGGTARPGIGTGGCQRLLREDVNPRAQKLAIDGRVKLVGKGVDDRVNLRHHPAPVCGRVAIQAVTFPQSFRALDMLIHKRHQAHVRIRTYRADVTNPRDGAAPENADADGALLWRPLRRRAGSLQQCCVAHLHLPLFLSS